MSSSSHLIDEHIAHGVGGMNCPQDIAAGLPEDIFVLTPAFGHAG
jgi:hypothetical protein